MILAPGSAETQIAIAEQAGERDLSDVGNRIELRRCGFQRREPARDLVGLAIDPGLHALVGRPVTALVDQQQAGIENAVAQRLQPQRREARLRLARNDAAAAGEMIEIFEDHARVIIGGAIIEDQHRDFSDRILCAYAIGGIVEIGFAHFDLVREPKQAGGDARLAAER